MDSKLKEMRTDAAKARRPVNFSVFLFRFSSSVERSDAAVAVGFTVVGGSGLLVRHAISKSE